MWFVEDGERRIEYLLALRQRRADTDVQICAELLERIEAAELESVGCGEVDEDAGDFGCVDCFGGCFGYFGRSVGCVLASHHCVGRGGLCQCWEKGSG
jgi:hypothetical protein